MSYSLHTLNGVVDPATANEAPRSLWVRFALEISLLLGGAVLVVDLRMLGFGLTGRTVSEIARNAKPWLMGAVIALIVTGIPLFLSEPTKCYYSPAFWVKMGGLAIALPFTFAIRNRIAAAEPVRNTARLQMLVGALSMALWITVAAAGRWIGFS